MPWIDRDDPINASTIDVFLNPKKTWHLSRTSAEGYLCASASHDASSCLCMVPFGDQHGRFLARLSWLPLMQVESVVNVQLAAERSCAAMWIPESVALVVLILTAACLFVCLEAFLAWRRLKAEQRQDESVGSQEVVLIASPSSMLYAGTSSAMGFAALIIATQTLGVKIVVSFGGLEAIVWSMIAGSGAIGVCGILLFYTVLCRNQLVQSCLKLKVCVTNRPSTKPIMSVLACAIFAYAFTVVACLLHSVDSVVDAVKVFALVAGAMVGPIMSLLKALRSSLESEQASVEVRMEAESFVEILEDKSTKDADQTKGWTCVSWSDVIAAGRSRDFPSIRNFGRRGAADHGQGWQWACVSVSKAAMVTEPCINSTDHPYREFDV